MTEHQKLGWLKNDDSKESYNTGSDIRFKTIMLGSNLCDYADTYIPAKETIANNGAGDNDAEKRLDERNKGVIFKNCAPFTKCITRINGTEIDNAQDIDLVMPMHTWLNIEIIIQKYRGLYSNITKMNQMITYHYVNLKQK